MPKHAPNTKRLLSLISNFSRKRVLVLGDLMLDHFIRGKVSRISPEAPVPVVAVHEESHVPGGGGNVSSNLTALGAQVSVYSVLGDDAAGDQLQDLLRGQGADTSGVLQDGDRVTTRKSRIIAEHQQIVRVDRETLTVLSASSRQEMMHRLKEALGKAHALIISDYGKGIVTGAVVREALRCAHRASVPVLVDPKVEHFKLYKGVDCVTPNTKEAWAGMRLLESDDEEDIDRLGRRIIKDLKLRSVLITRGEKGMSLYERSASTKVTHIPTEAREVYDVTGAGDTVISVMALALASGAKLHEAAVLANIGAGIVVGKLGTAMVTAAELRRAITSRSKF